MRVRALKLRAGESLSRAIVVKPSFARLEACDDRVTCRRVVFRCMLIWRSIAAADVTAFDASAKMEPPSARSRAFHATRSGWRGREVDAIPLRLHRATHWKCSRSPRMHSRRDLRHAHILPVFCPTGQHRDGTEPLAKQLGARSHKVAAAMRSRDKRHRSATKNRHIVPVDGRLQRCQFQGAGSGARTACEIMLHCAIVFAGSAHDCGAGGMAP